MSNDKNSDNDEWVMPVVILGICFVGGMIGYPESNEDTVGKAIGYSSSCMIISAIIWGFLRDWAKKNFYSQLTVYAWTFGIVYTISQFILHK